MKMAYKMSLETSVIARLLKLDDQKLLEYFRNQLKEVQSYKMSFEKGVQSRRERLQLLKKMLNENQHIPLRIVLAKFAVMTGVTMTTARRYYRLLLQAGEVKPHPTK